MIDPNKKYRTRRGQAVTMLHRAPEGWDADCPWRGLVNGQSIGWNDAGMAECAGQNYDLVEVREPREFRIGIHTESGHAYVMQHSESPAYEFIRVREVLEP